MSFMLTNLGGFGAGGDNIGGNDSFTKLLLHCDAADGTTTFTDSSAAAHTITPGGNAQIDTAQAKFGASSVLFDGTGDFLVADGHADFAFGTGDFAIDFWLRPNAINAFKALYDSRPSATEGAYPVLFFDGSGTFSSSNVLFYYQSSAVRITGTTALATGTWYHVAVTRSGTDTKLFLNGTQEGSTYSDSTNYGVGASRPALGIFTDGSTGALNGWLDEIRVSKGAARWTANFTPPTGPYTAE
jgi:hypothetical protein